MPPHLKAALDAAVTPEVSRSEVVAQLIARHLLPAPQAQAPTDQPKPKRRPLPEHLRPGYVPPAAPVKPSLDNLEALRVVRVQLDPDTKNALRWRQEHYDRLQALLAQGDTIQRKRIGGKVAWRTANNDTIRRDTLDKLLEAGNVVPLT